jgi:hypothetical protein
VSAVVRTRPGTVKLVRSGQGGGVDGYNSNGGVDVVLFCRSSGGSKFVIDWGMDALSLRVHVVQLPDRGPYVDLAQLNLMLLSFTCALWEVRAFFWLFAVLDSVGYPPCRFIGPASSFLFLHMSFLSIICTNHGHFLFPAYRFRGVRVIEAQASA